MPYHSKENERRAKELAQRFREAKTPAQYVMGYFFGRPFGAVPVFGAGSMEQLKDTIYAAEHPLAPGIWL
jgi:aryl-alcohol dehydrogenase-like predicted oxidoreductase